MQRRSWSCAILCSHNSSCDLPSITGLTPRPCCPWSMTALKCQGLYSVWDALRAYCTTVIHSCQVGKAKPAQGGRMRYGTGVTGRLAYRAMALISRLVHRAFRIIQASYNNTSSHSAGMALAGVAMGKANTRWGVGAYRWRFPYLQTSLRLCFSKREIEIAVQE